MLSNTQTHWMGNLVIRGTFLLNLTSKDLSWMVNFHEKRDELPTNKWEQEYQGGYEITKFNYTDGIKRMVTTTNTIDTLALKFNSQMV